MRGLLLFHSMHLLVEKLLTEGRGLIIIIIINIFEAEAEICQWRIKAEDG